ncbi:MAG: putative hydrolase of alkaline phosphatase superfamily [Solidesulfovibrio magneticus str. Maddingley MBC34]|uniref:Putative hydrolase of alkaline phosphatase superfamily n=1 Tax=Solidesulfovibrio magneticus str. Maddingley MBC34 TaxID=1206767 RepID=K6H8W5_9BACT|nr:MAG: putative hydrolase of alkaline phosphatase superfamily [Solidesulfovibrio magneticus str. Maddingley MBC34]
MPLATKKPRDIVWLCIDSLRVDCLRTGGNAQAHPNFFDRLFKESVFFSRCLATGQGTLASAFSFFTSLLPSVTGVVSQTANCIVQADPRAVTVTDILKHHGYSTWRYDDMGTYSCQPKSGFDHFEGGYFNLQDTPGLSFDAPRRNAFLARVNQATSPLFLYLHLDYLHEFGGESSPVWSRDRYCGLVAAVSREVRDLLGKITRINEAILLVNTDHGVTLDEDWARFEKLHGGNLSEARVRTFAAFRAPGLAPRRIDATISSLDLAPTLLDLVGLPDMKAQGRSLVEAMAGGVLTPQPAVSQWAPSPNTSTSSAGPAREPSIPFGAARTPGLWCGRGAARRW